MVERANLEAEFLGQVEHLGHLVGTIAVVLNEDLAAQNAGKGLELEVPNRRIALPFFEPLVPPPTVVLGLDIAGPIARHVAHAG